MTCSSTAIHFSYELSTNFRDNQQACTAVQLCCFSALLLQGPGPKHASLAMELLMVIDIFPGVMIVTLVCKGFDTVVLVTMDEIMSAMQ